MAVKGWHGYGGGGSVGGFARGSGGGVGLDPPPARSVSSPGKPVKTATCCITYPPYPPLDEYIYNKYIYIYLYLSIFYIYIYFIYIYLHTQSRYTCLTAPRNLYIQRRVYIPRCFQGRVRNVRNWAKRARHKHHRRFE